ncbi:MAG: DUF1499 domain-containing protein [Rhodospirillales bacterium]|jgi:uncharacterized protein (DUF1499 family)
MTKTRLRGPILGLLAICALSGCSAFTYPAPGPSRQAMGLDAAVAQPRLAPCPSSPNCVCTFDRGPEHAIAAFAYTKAPADVMAGIETTLLADPKVRLLEKNDARRYMHFAFKVGVLGFVDDVEFFIDESTKTVQFRSASRIGHSDMGVNRRRLEGLRAVLPGRI